jgi:hypothetical protein
MNYQKHETSQREKEKKQGVQLDHPLGKPRKSSPSRMKNTAIRASFCYKNPIVITQVKIFWDPEESFVLFFGRLADWQKPKENKTEEREKGKG